MTGCDTGRHRRRSIRLKGSDYAQPGAYFVTICTKGSLCLFGSVTGDGMELNEAGQTVQATWEALPERFPGLELDAFVVMPNHVHGIVVFVDTGKGAAAYSAEATASAAKAGSSAPTHRTDGDVRPVPDVHPGRTVGPSDTGVGAGLALPKGKGAVPRAADAPTDHTGAGLVSNASDLPAAGANAGTPARADGGPGRRTLGNVIRAFKSLSAVHVHRLLGRSGALWQRNYCEHVIRNEESLNRIREYIIINPAQWQFDRENPDANAATSGDAPWQV